MSFFIMSVIFAVVFAPAFDVHLYLKKV